MEYRNTVNVHNDQTFHHPVPVLLLVISWIFCLQFEQFSVENTLYKLYTYLRHIYPSVRYNIFKNEQTALRYKITRLSITMTFSRIYLARGDVFPTRALHHLLQLAPAVLHRLDDAGREDSLETLRDTRLLDDAC